MAKIEYTAKCLCGGDIQTVFKKPTRFQNAISRTTCSGCLSEYMFTFSLEYKDGTRAYVPEHELLKTSPLLKDVIKYKKERLNEL